MEDKKEWHKYYRLAILVDGSTHGVEVTATSLSHALEQELKYYLARPDVRKAPAQINISREKS